MHTDVVDLSLSSFGRPTLVTMVLRARAVTLRLLVFLFTKSTVTHAVRFAMLPGKTVRHRETAPLVNAFLEATALVGVTKKTLKTT